jgi:hypothetical protein
MMLFDPAVPTDDGHWVSEQFERLARIVSDYDPQFELRWIPPENRTELEDKAKPYVVWDTVTNSPVFFASELDTPVDILTRLFEGDNSKHDVLKRIDAHNAAVEAMRLKEELDKREEQMEYAAWLIGTEKNYIQLGKGRKVDDQLRPLE